GELTSAAAESASRRESPRKPSDPVVIKLRRVVGCCMVPPLMILREFTGANQGPDKFMQPVLAISALRQNGFQLLHFIAGGRTAERGKVELSENLLIGCARFQQLRQTAVGPAEAVHVGRSGQHVHRLAEVRLVVPLRNGAAIGAPVLPQ